jgi:glycosyltransferase involved in cell wall biosynthesis
MALNGLIAGLPPPPPGRAGWPWTEATNPAVYSVPPRAGAWPKITVVTPSFNQGRFIEETIRSVLLQNYPALEYVVMDGGSTDETVSILQRYAPWLTRWESAPDRGQSHALNKGFARATGEIYGWINSDDYYLPGAFALVARRHHPGKRELHFGDYMVRQDEARELRYERLLPAFAWEVMVGGRTLPSHATFWPRIVHAPLDETLQFIMDADLFKRLGGAGVKPRHVPAALAVFRGHAAAKTSTLDQVAARETQAWFRSVPWYYFWLHRVSRLLDRARRRVRRPPL